MSTCARCGLTEGCGPSLCEALCDDPDELGEATVNCRDRELANLRSLLRSVTGKLEEIAEALEGDYLDSEDTEFVRGLVDAVLEALS